MISSRRSLRRPVQPVWKILSLLRNWVTGTAYRPERHYMRGGR
jgi:hypothetical protein